MKYFETKIKQVTKNIFLTSEGDKIYAEHSNFAVTDDTVLVKTNNNKFFVHKIIERTNDPKHGVVFFNKKKNSYCIKPFGEYITYYIDEKFVIGSIVEFVFGDYDKKNKRFCAEIVSEYTGKKDYLAFKIDSVLNKSFTEQVLLESESLIFNTDKNRIDFSSDDFVTFDSLETAYSFEATSYGSRVKIAVPDVPSILRGNTKTDHSAYLRGFRYNINDTIYPLLPTNLTEKLYLYEKTDRNVICLIINFNRNDEVINYCFSKASINVKKNNINKNAVNDPGDIYYSFLNRLLVIGNKQGEYENDISSLWNKISNRLVYQFLYKNEQIVYSFINNEYILSNSSESSMPFTNPLSSYMDILTSRIISNSLVDKPTILADISKDCEYMNEKLKEKKELENIVKTVKDISKLKGKKIYGVVVKVTPSYSVVHTNSNIEGVIYSKLRVDQKVDMMIDQDNSFDKLIFKIV